MECRKMFPLHHGIFNSVSIMKLVMMMLIVHSLEHSEFDLNKSENITIPHEQQVYAYLMKNYEKSVRPLKNHTKQLTIQMKIRLQQIFELNERNQVLSTLLFLEQVWQDEYLKWDESAFGNVRTLRIPSKKVWTPDTYVFNNADYSNSGFLDGIYVLVYSSGKILWPIPIQLKTFCPVDITLFPFDKQICDIKFGSWIYNNQWINYEFQFNNLNNNSTTKQFNNHNYYHNHDQKNNLNKETELNVMNALDISSYWDSVDWILKSVKLYYSYRPNNLFTIDKINFRLNSSEPNEQLLSTLLLASSSSSPSSILTTSTTSSSLSMKLSSSLLLNEQKDLLIRIELKRQSFYYVWNIVIPCILLTLLTLIIFWTPVNCGEKITLGLSVFLAFSMFMMLIAERVPPTSKCIPLIGVYMTSVMTLTAASVVVCVIVINLDSRGEKMSRAPKWIRTFLENLLVMKLFNMTTIHESTSRFVTMEKLTNPYKSHDTKLLELHEKIANLQQLRQTILCTEKCLKNVQNTYEDYIKLSHNQHVETYKTEPTNLESEFSLTTKIINPYFKNYSQSSSKVHLNKKCNLSIENFNHDNYMTSDNINITKINHISNQIKSTNPIADHRKEFIKSNQNNITNEEKIFYEFTEQDVIKFEWKLLAQFIDQCLFVIFLFITIVCYLIIFLAPLY